MTGRNSNTAIPQESLVSSSRKPLEQARQGGVLFSRIHERDSDVDGRPLTAQDFPLEYPACQACLCQGYPANKKERALAVHETMSFVDGERSAGHYMSDPSK